MSHSFTHWSRSLSWRLLLAAGISTPASFALAAEISVVESAPAPAAATVGDPVDEPSVGSAKANPHVIGDDDIGPPANQEDGEYAGAGSSEETSPAASAGVTGSNEAIATPTEETAEESTPAEEPATAPTQTEALKNGLRVVPQNEAGVGQPQAEVTDAGNPGHADHEVIRERYTNGKIKIEREVTQDAQENYINDGSWEMWTEAGQVVARGEFRKGLREGVWTSWFGRQDAEILSAMPFAQFTPPFVSEAKFIDGKIEGAWEIRDAGKRLCASWHFIDGQRDGKSNWFFPNGAKMREIDFKQGAMDGKLIEWNSIGQPVVDVTYINGRRLAPSVAYYPQSQQKKVEAQVLHGRLTVKTADDWWTLMPATYEKQGTDERHGEWTAWYPNGQMKTHGEYHMGAEEGSFTWWYPNGQKQAEGTFLEGKPNGKFTWWHENGVKMRQGDFIAGAPTGRWTQWSPEGKVLNHANPTDATKEISKGQAKPGDSASTNAAGADRTANRQAIPIPAMVKPTTEGLETQESYLKAGAPR